MLMDLCLRKFDIYHKLKQTQTFDTLIFFLKKRVLCGVPSQIDLVRCNIVSTEQPVRA